MVETGLCCARLGVGPRLLPFMNVRVRVFGALIWGSSVLVAGRALAEPTTEELSLARQSFKEAVTLEGEQKWVEATAKLRRALVVKDTPGLRFHLAHCEEKQGLLVAAAADYDRALELLAQGAKAPDVQKLLAPAAADVKSRIPRLTLEIPADVASPTVVIDGKAAVPSELTQGQALDPGNHEVRVAASGRSPFVRELMLKEGDQVTLRAELPEAPAAHGTSGVPKAARTSAPAMVSVPATHTPSAHASAEPYLLVGEAVITAAGLALGVGYAVAASSAGDRVTSAQSQIDHSASTGSSACAMPSSSVDNLCADLRGAIDEHDRDTTLSTVGFVTAGVGAAALVTTALFYPSGRERKSGVSVQPVLSLGRVGLRGSF